MSPVSLLRASFSRHEIAAIGQVCGLILAVVMFAAIFKGQEWFAVAAGALLLFVTALARFASACPTCGKWPMQLRLGLRSRDLDEIFAVGRFWPERICSECGTNLDEH